EQEKGVQRELSLSDKVLLGDLLRFYTPTEDWEPVDPTQYHYSNDEPVEKEDKNNDENIEENEDDKETKDTDENSPTKKNKLERSNHGHTLFPLITSFLFECVNMK